MGTPASDDRAAAAAQAELVEQVRELVAWVGEGRKLTQRKRVTLTDARTLVDLLDTGDVIDPMIGDRVFRTVSSAELLELNMIVEAAKAARLLRVTGQRLVPVKRNAALLDRPLELWSALFEAFPRFGTACLPTGWVESLMHREFTAGASVVLAAMYGRDGPVARDELCALAWETVTAPYVLEPATDQQLEHWKAMNDRDVGRALEVLERLGAAMLGEDTAELTTLGRYGMRRARGEPEPGDPVLELTISLMGVEDPRVWRRVQVPAAIRLDRLHEVIQAAMGWENSHLHVFDDGKGLYGTPDPELEFHDESKAQLGDLVDEGGRLGYGYDFGDDWEHDIVVERALPAEPGTRYPTCLDGGGACPPEDCGGPPGYERLREVLADPAHEEHEDMAEWLGLTNAADFDPARFDAAEANRALATVGVR